MILRALLFIGVLLIVAALVGLGRPHMPNLWDLAEMLSPEVKETVLDNAPRFTSAPPAADFVVPQQTWLISPGGGLVRRDAAEVYLRQDRFHRDRTVSLSMRAPLTRLLSEGEVLPAPVYHTAFASVRAPALATSLCQPLMDTIAQGCSLVRAHLVDDSYDPATVTAEFVLELAFTLKPGPAPLPDLSAHVLRSDMLRVEPGPDMPDPTVEELLALAARKSIAACSLVPTQSCRVSRMRVKNGFDDAVSVQVTFDYLAPLPNGMYTAPPLY